MREQIIDGVSQLKYETGKHMSINVGRNLNHIDFNSLLSVNIWPHYLV